jgi:hypothetical protein
VGIFKHVLLGAVIVPNLGTLTFYLNQNFYVVWLLIFKVLCFYFYGVLEILFGGANHLAPWHLEWISQ